LPFVPFFGVTLWARRSVLVRPPLDIGAPFFARSVLPRGGLFLPPWMLKSPPFFAAIPLFRRRRRALSQFPFAFPFSDDDTWLVRLGDPYHSFLAILFPYLQRTYLERLAAFLVFDLRPCHKVFPTPPDPRISLISLSPLVKLLFFPCSCPRLPVGKGSFSLLPDL